MRHDLRLNVFLGLGILFLIVLLPWPLRLIRPLLMCYRMLYISLGNLRPLSLHTN